MAVELADLIGQLRAELTEAMHTGENETRARALAVEAAGFEQAAGREVVGARRYVAEVLASDAWPEALEAVAQVDLPALQRFADEVLG